ncbi:MAG: DUF4335 domain-containing protein [Cyanobacteria bacterium P01_H01_bin.105]
MTIQRQYVLPNCSLVLEGLSADTSNVLSILANAEFKIVGIEQSLSGGTEFFNALVGAVSAYCQRLISGLDHPEHLASQSSLVAVEPDEGQYHRLIVKPEILNSLSGDEASDTASQTIKLSTVQLFDMAEAIDQFYADAQTLPEVSINLAPLPRKYVRPEEPLTQRAIPPLLGFGTLAVAALGLFFLLPVPELSEPEGLESQSTNPLEEPFENESGSAPPPGVTPEPTEDATDTVADLPEQNNSTITDSAQLAELQQQIQQQISSAQDDDAPLEQPLSYQISVAENGDIVAYTPLDGPSLENLDNTPLPALTYIPVEATADAAASGPVAEFDVTFATDGTVEVTSDQLSVIPETDTPEVVEPSPAEEEDREAEGEARGEAGGEETSEDDPSEQSSTPFSDSTAADTSSITPTSTSGELSTSIATPIQDADRIYALNQELRRTIIDNRDRDRSGPEVRYRVRLDEDGNVTGYEASNAAAERYAAALKMPSLVKATADNQPQLDFLVVINDENVVQVNPWDGWP